MTINQGFFFNVKTIEQKSIKEVTNHNCELEFSCFNNLHRFLISWDRTRIKKKVVKKYFYFIILRQ